MQLLYLFIAIGSCHFQIESQTDEAVWKIDVSLNRKNVSLNRGNKNKLQYTRFKYANMIVYSALQLLYTSTSDLRRYCI